MAFLNPNKLDLPAENSPPNPTLTSTPSPSANIKVKGSRIDKHGFIYLTLTGTSQERGYAHGFLLADRIVKMSRTFAFFVWTEYGRDITFLHK